MRNMREVFYLPVVVPVSADDQLYDNHGVLLAEFTSRVSAKHSAIAINHADALADALEWMIEIAKNVDTGLYDYSSAKAALAAYRGEA